MNAFFFPSGLFLPGILKNVEMLNAVVMKLSEKVRQYEVVIGRTSNSSIFTDQEAAAATDKQDEELRSSL